MVEKEPYGEVFLINKPYRWTSFDVVKKVRNALGIKKVGHAGTLDPLATGLLIVCAGKMTKKIDSFQAQEKEYTGTFVLGKTTESFDLERVVIEVSDPLHLTVKKSEAVAIELNRDIVRVTPTQAAIKTDHTRVYESARKGIDVVLEQSPVTVSLFDITRFELPEIDFRIICSK